MALTRQQKQGIFGGIVAVLAIGALVQLGVMFVHFGSVPTVSIARDDQQMTQNYGDLPTTATQDDVLAAMGSQFAVRKCPSEAGEKCAHIWHYESSDQAWNFTFDVDGNLMKKALGTVGE